MTSLPKTPSQARAELPIWKERKTLAYAQLVAARVAWEQASTNYDVVAMVAGGEFSADPPVPDLNYYGAVRPTRTYAVGSHGAWGWSL